MYINIYMYIHMYTCVHIYKYIYIYIFYYVCICICMYIWVYICTCIYVYMHRTWLGTYLYACVWRVVFVSICDMPHLNTFIRVTWLDSTRDTLLFNTYIGVICLVLKCKITQSGIKYSACLRMARIVSIATWFPHITHDERSSNWHSYVWHDAFLRVSQNSHTWHTVGLPAERIVLSDMTRFLGRHDSYLWHTEGFPNTL